MIIIIFIIIAAIEEAMENNHKIAFYLPET